MARRAGTADRAARPYSFRLRWTRLSAFPSVFSSVFSVFPPQSFLLAFQKVPGLDRRRDPRGRGEFKSMKSRRVARVVCLSSLFSAAVAGLAGSVCVLSLRLFFLFFFVSL